MKNLLHILMVHLLIVGFSIDLSMGDVALLAEGSDDAGIPLIITEFLAINGSKLPLNKGNLLDEDGDSSDWIEIFNSTDTTIILNSWYLTDDANDLTRWELPNIQIDPGQYKIIFASGKDRDDPDGELHTNFQLVGGPGFLGIVGPDGETIVHAYEYPQQFGDLSYGLSSEAAGLVTETTLIREFAPSTALIPTDDSLGQDWTEPGFDDSAWLSGNTGVGYDYPGLIGLDVRAMRNSNQTVYVRVPFEVSNISAIDELTLRLKYEDGFVAYLNGLELGRDNAPGLLELMWNSGATANRPDDTAVGFQDFDITPYKDVLVEGNNVLAIHGLNNGLGSSDLLILPEIIAIELESSELSTMTEGYFYQPTPGEQNSGVLASLGPAIRNVTDDLPLLDYGIDLVITAEVKETFAPVDEVSLIYRVDFGQDVSVPMVDNGTVGDAIAYDNIYTGIIPFITYRPGDMVRWKVVSSDIEGTISSNPLFLIKGGRIQSPEYFGTVVVDPTVRTALPVFQYFVQNIGAAGSRTGTRASVFYLDEFYDNVFVRLRGGYTTHGRKFEFNDGHHFLFDPNIPRVDEINLNERGAEPTYIRQVLGWETYVNADQPGSLSFPMHVRRNGSFLAVRIFIEQPDRDLLRRNNLDPDGALYKMYDDLQNGRIDGEGIHRKKTRLDEDSGDLLALADGIDARNLDRDTFLFDNVNIPAMINYWASSVIMHENDHTHKNYYAYRDTLDPTNNPNGTNEWMFLPWDKDLTFGINNGIGGVIADQDWPGDIRSPSHPFYGCSEHQKNDRQWNCVIDALHDNPITRQMYLRRLRTLMDDLLQPPGTPVPELKFEKRIDELKAQLYIELGGGGWNSNVERIKTDYLAIRRHHLFNNHSIHNPGYDQNAGIPDAQPPNPIINFGDYNYNPTSGNQDEEYIQLVNPNSYAVEISGWKLTNAVEHEFLTGTVIVAGGSLYVCPNSAAFRSRANSPTGGEGRFVQGNYRGHLSSWGETINLEDKDGTLVSTLTYQGNPSDQQRYLRITEIMYHPADPCDGSLYNCEEFEYVELRNIGTTQLFLGGVKFTQGILFNFPNINLPAGAYIVVVKNQAAFESRHIVPSNVQVLGPYEGQLSNRGERIKLEDPTNSTILEYDYKDGWYDITDGSGFSLTVIDPVNTELNDWDQKESWRASAYIDGSPGLDDSGIIPNPNAVVINELLANSPGNNPDWIELYNTTNTAIDIDGWFLSDSGSNLTKYEIAPGTSIPPNGYIVFYEDRHFNNPTASGSHERFALSENGERIYLSSARDGVLTGYQQDEDFGASEIGVSLGRYYKSSTGNYNFVAMSESTPGSANSEPKVGPVVINEIMYNPSLPDGGSYTNEQYEYIELYNISTEPVSLEGWKFTDGIDFTFSEGVPVTISAGGYLLVVKHPEAFSWRYPSVSVERILGPYDGRLSNAGERLELSMPGGVDASGVRSYIRVDRVGYSDGSHPEDCPGGVDLWPSQSDGEGQSLTRRVSADYGNDPDNWDASAPSPGQ